MRELQLAYEMMETQENQGPPANSQPIIRHVLEHSQVWMYKITLVSSVPEQICHWMSPCYIVKSPSSFKQTMGVIHNVSEP